MTGLAREAHRLMELARAGDDPTAAQLLSLHGSVAARIASEAAVAASGSASGVAKATSAGALFKGLIAAGAIATGAGGYFLLQEPEPAAPAAPPALVHAAPARPPRVAPPPPPISAQPAPEPEAPPQPARAVKPPALRLEDEAALLAEVQGALRSGQARVALGKLDSYDRRFPGGMLRSEADAARVFALCAAGRVEKARAAAARFVQRYPSAPATGRVQAACK